MPPTLGETSPQSGEERVRIAEHVIRVGPQADPPTVSESLHPGDV